MNERIPAYLQGFGAGLAVAALSGLTQGVQALTLVLVLGGVAVLASMVLEDANSDSEGVIER